MITANYRYGIEILAGSENIIIGQNMLDQNNLGAGHDAGANTLQKATNYPAF